MLKTWWFEGAAVGLHTPAAGSFRGPTVSHNRAMITPTLRTSFSVPPQLSALRFQPSRHVIAPAPFTLSLPASPHRCPLHQRRPHAPPCHAAIDIIITYVPSCIVTKKEKNEKLYRVKKNLRLIQLLFSIIYTCFAITKWPNIFFNDFKTLNYEKHFCLTLS